MSETALRLAVAISCSVCCLALLAVHRIFDVSFYPPGSGARLARLIGLSDRIIVRPAEQPDTVLFASDQLVDRQQLAASLQLIDPGAGSCTRCDCAGDWSIELRRDDELLQRITIFRDWRIALAGSDCQLPLRLPARWRQWRERRGFSK